MHLNIPRLPQAPQAKTQPPTHGLGVTVSPVSLPPSSETCSLFPFLFLLGSSTSGAARGLPRPREEHVPSARPGGHRSRGAGDRPAQATAAMGSAGGPPSVGWGAVRRRGSGCGERRGAGRQALGEQGTWVVSEHKAFLSPPGCGGREATVFPGTWTNVLPPPLGKARQG